MAKMTFVLGGARSGKSAFAEELAKKYNDVVYIATAEVKDEEMRDGFKFIVPDVPLTGRLLSPHFM